MGTDGGGMDLFDPKNETFQEFRQTEGMKIVSIIPYNDSELLLSLFGVGLYRFNKKTGECREFPLNWGNIRKDLFLCGNAIRLYRVDEDRFCLLTDNYLFVYDQRKQQFEIFSENMVPNFQAPRFITGDSCYISTSAGLYVLDFLREERRPVFLPGEGIGTLTAVKQGKDKRFGWGRLPACMFMIGFVRNWIRSIRSVSSESRRLLLTIVTNCGSVRMKDCMRMFPKRSVSLFSGNPMVFLHMSFCRNRLWNPFLVTSIWQEWKGWFEYGRTRNFRKKRIFPSA